MNPAFLSKAVPDGSTAFLPQRSRRAFWRYIWVLGMLILSALLPRFTKAATYTVGSGSSDDSRFPINAYYGYSYSQSTYLASELVTAGATLGSPGYINSISFNITYFPYDFSYCKDWAIYMGNTAKTTFSGSSDWVPASALTKVFDGSVSPTTTGWFTITLTTPFYWDGSSNIIIGVDENTYWRVYDNCYFASTPRSGIRSIGNYDYYTNPDPASPLGAYSETMSATPDVEFDFTPASACSGTIVAGTAVSSATTLCSGSIAYFDVTGASTGSGISYEWESSPSGLAGTWTSISGATSSIYSTVPPNATTTYYRRKITCSYTSTSDYSTPVAVSVSPAIVPPYTEDFETATVGVNIPCAGYTSTWGMGGVGWYIYDGLYCSAQNHTPGGSKYLLGGYGLEVATGNQDFWFTPPLDLGAGKTYRFSYWHMNDGYAGNNPGTGAYIGTAQSRSAMTAIGPFINSASTTYKQYVTDFSVPSSGIYYAGIRVRSTYNCDFGVDDINLIELPDCNTATALGAGGKAIATPNVICSVPGTTTLSLSGTPAFSGLSFSWEVASGTPTSFSSAGISSASGSYAIATGGVYYFRCVISCPATGLVTYSDTVKVLTTPITPPYVENFESATVPDNLPCAGYTGIWGSPGYYWTTAAAGSPGSSVENHTSGGSKLLLAGGQLGIGTGALAYWYTPGLSLTAGKAYDISFWYKTASYGSWMDSYNYQIGLAYGSSQTSSAMTILDDTTLPHSDMKSWRQFKRGFVASASGVQYIGILANSSEWVGYGVNIDDIGIEQLPPCAATPVAGKTVASPSMICSSGSAFLRLKGTSAASDLTFQWQESPTGLPGTWVDAVGGTGSTSPGFTTPSLSTSIYYRCVVICGLITAPNADTSSALRVQVGPIEPPYIEDFETATAGVNQPCAAISFDYYGFWESSTSTTSYNGWSIKDKPGAYTENTNVRNHTAGGKYYLSAGQNLGDAYFGSSSPESDQQYWFSPPLQLTGGGMAYRCNYWYVNNAYPWTIPAANYGLYYGTTQDPYAMKPIRADIKGETNTDYKEISGTLRPASSGVYYLGVKFRNTNWASNYGHAIDDIGVTQLPVCTGTPVAGAVQSKPARICSSGTADLSLTGTTEASMISFRWQESATGTSGWTDVAGGSGATSDVYTTDVLSAPRWYRCIVTCSAAALPNTDTTEPFEMLAGSLDLPYVEDFETTTPGENVICAAFSGPWGSAADYYYTTVRGMPVTAYTTIDQHTPGGSNMLWLGYGLSYSGDFYWWTPGLNLEKDSTYEFSYWYNGPAYPYGGTGPTLGMYYGTEQADWAMTPIRPDVNNVNISTYKQMIGRFVSSGTGVYYFGIKVNMPSWMDPGIAIDDIGINQLPSCTGAPTAGVVSVAPSMLCSAGGTANLDMDLAGVSKVAGLSYTWYSSTTGPTGPWTAMSGVLDGPSFTTPGLASTSWFYCEVKCTNTGDFTNSSIIKVDVGVILPPYIETFETNISGYNMPCASNTAYWSGPTYAWYINSSPVGAWAPTADNHTPGGSKYLQAGYALGSPWSFPGPQYWFSPAIRFTGGKLYQFTFWYNGPGVSATGVTSTIGAYYGTSQSPAAMTTAIGPDLVINQFTYKQYKQQFTPATSGDYYIGLKVENAGYDPGVSFDDIGLQEVPPCSDPVEAGTIISDPGHICAAGGSAVLDLEGSTLATGLNYEWMSASSPAGPYTLTGGTGLPYNTDPLSTNTWFRAIVTCAASGAKDTSEAFKVGVGGMSVPYSEDFEKWAVGQRPICSDATYWGLYSYDGWRLSSGDVSGYGMKNHTPGGKNYMWASYYFGAYGGYSPMTDDNYWFTPGLALDARYKYAFSFWYQGNANFIHRVGAFYGTSQSVGAMTNTLMTFREINSSAYAKFDTIFKPATSGTYYIGLKKATESLGFWENSGVAYDDINLNYAPCDGIPFTGNIHGSVTPGTALCLNTPVTLIDTGATINLVPGIKYQWMRRIIGSAGTWSAVAGATDTVLKADTLIGFEYKFGVICGNTNDTAYSSVFQLPALPAHPPVTLSPATSPVSYCLGDTVKFNATNYTSAVYDWMIDSVVQFGWKFSDMGATEPGEYMVRVTSPLSPCPAYSNKVKLEVNDPGYAIEIGTPADSIICEGSSLLLTAMASKPGVTIKWRKDNVDIPFATSASYLVTTSGYYRAMATDGSSACAAVTRNIHIIVQPNPDAKITVPGGTLTACENEGVVLKSSSGYSYEWLRSGITMSGSVDDSLVVKTSGSYSVKVRTSAGCMDISTPVTVNILPSPDPVITKTTLGSGSVRLSTTAFLSYQWYRNGVKIPGATAQTLDLIMNGTYTVVVIGTNSCEGSSDPIEIDEDGLSIGNPGVQTEQIRIYPNPTQSVVFIESPVAVRVSVKDITGKTVLQAQEVKEVDLSKYADGVYLFTISDREGNELIRQQRVTKFTK